MIKPKYSIMMCDPPWPNKKGGKRKVRPKQKRSLDYPTMDMDEIFSLLDKNLFPMMEDTHTVFMWAIERFLPKIETKMGDRNYKLHCRMIWDKTNGIAPAFTVRFSHEYLLWFYKPKMLKIPEALRGKFTTVFREKARQHSRKPDVAYEMVSALYPDFAKIDVFSREKRDGWDQWGNDINHF